MNRRIFLKRAVQGGVAVLGLNLVGCGKEEPEGTEISEGSFRVWSSRGEVILYDTYAQALYYDGTLGPKTGIIKVDYILANEPVTLEFWHGHGGRNHQYTVTPAHFAELKKLKRVTVETSVIDGHTHKLFIEPKDPKWRVPGAKPVPVPVPEKK